MAFMDTLLRLERLAHLIDRRSTGNREDLARRMGVSLRTVDYLVQLLRNLCEVKIYFCSIRQSYCFAEDIEIRFGVVRRTGESHKLT